MKKLISLAACSFVAACLFTAPSCKKVYHGTNVTPSNVRLSGFTRVITKNTIVPITPTPVVTETYAFRYDGSNRLLQVLFSTNDSNQRMKGQLNLRMDYSYGSGGTVTRTIYNLKDANLIETDQFTYNANGLLTSSSFPWESHKYSYAGKLIASITDTYSDSGTTINATYNFTSDNKDLLHQQFNGKLTATFPDKGIRPVILPNDTTRDSVLTYPIDVTWTSYNLTSAGITTTTTNHNGVKINTDDLNDYGGNMESVDAHDANGIYVRRVYFPAGLTSSKFFQIYDFLDNRPGDYLQLESFKTYGVNIYQNQHLIKALSSDYDSTSVKYDIDAQSKITETHVFIKDKFGNKTVLDYRLQYETIN